MSCLWWPVCLTRCQTQLQLTHPHPHPGSILQNTRFYPFCSPSLLLHPPVLSPEICFLIKCTVNVCSSGHKNEGSQAFAWGVSWGNGNAERQFSPLTTWPYMRVGAEHKGKWLVEKRRNEGSVKNSLFHPGEHLCYLHYAKKLFEFHLSEGGYMMAQWGRALKSFAFRTVTPSTSICIKMEE